MQEPDESSTSRRQLPERWVRKIFAELQGNYGSRFLAQWQTNQRFADDHPRAGEDVGLVNAMAVWAKKLGGFSDAPAAISEALACLPSEPPSLPEFVALCREQARRIASGTGKLEHKPTPAEKARADEAAKRAREATSALQPRKDHRDWANRIAHAGSRYPIAEQMAADALSAHG